MKTNWQTFLSPGSELPPDVTFCVKLDGQSKSFGAHRWLLAGISTVFRRMFFGSIGEPAGEVVEVKETTPEAFSTMINFIYMPPEELFNLQDVRCPQKLFEVMALAERYEILELKMMASDALENLAISRENMIFTATVAHNYKSTGFDSVGQKLMVKCLKFLYDTTSGAGDIGVLIMETEKNFPDASFEIFRHLISVGNETFQQPGNLRLIIDLMVGPFQFEIFHRLGKADLL